MNDSGKQIIVSVVTPVYRGERYLPELVQSLENERERWRRCGCRISLAEAIFVLDSPVDDSAEVLRSLAKDHPWLRIVELSRNYGQHSATVAGILHSSGDWVVSLDEDMQHDPARIPDLLDAACRHHADIVYAMPKDQVHGGGWRDRLSRWTKRIIARTAGNTDVLKFNSFRLIRGDVARAAASICAQHTYLDLALTWYTDRIHVLPIDMVDVRFLEHQQSGYSFWRLVQHGKRLLMTSEFKVLRFSVSIAVASVSVAGLYGSWIVYRRLFTEAGYDVAGWPSLALMILLFGAAAVFLLGLLLEFTHVIMLQLQGKPAFFVVNRDQDRLLREELPKLLSHADTGA